jgi:hypothetical protein
VRKDGGAALIIALQILTLNIDGLGDALSHWRAAGKGSGGNAGERAAAGSVCQGAGSN